jgi:hypothetical protein
LTDTRERWNWQVERAQAAADRTGPDGVINILFSSAMLDTQLTGPAATFNAVLQLFKMTYGFG